jgi:hypothetical protein
LSFATVLGAGLEATAGDARNVFTCDEFIEMQTEPTATFSTRQIDWKEGFDFARVAAAAKLANFGRFLADFWRRKCERRSPHIAHHHLPS